MKPGAERTTPAVSVVVVAYNSGPDLAECLADLRREAESLPLEAIVVDNASSDGSLEPAAAANPEAVVIKNRINLGFAAAANLGFAAAAGRHLMALNPDCRLLPGALSELVEYLDRHPEVGALGPKIYDPDGGVQLSARGPQTPLAFLFNRYSLLTRLWPDNPVSRRYLMSDWDHDRVREVAWLSGAALMLRREVVERIGFFDERFFLFHEDVDLCRRIVQAGFKVVYLPRAEIVHRIGISKRRDSVRLLQIRHRSMIHYIHKHYRRLGPLLWLADLAVAWRFGLTAAASWIGRGR